MNDPGDPLILRLESSLLYRFAVIASRAAAHLYAFYHERYGMSVPAWRVMAHLGESQPMNAKEVAQRAAMDSVSVTRALNQLHALGLLIRTVDGDDRRRVVLRLSRKGQAAYDTIAPLSVAAERGVVAELTPEERSTLYELTLRIWQRSPEPAPSGGRARRSSR